MPWLLQIGLGNALLAAVPALAALAAARWGRRPALAHALWLVALLKLLTPPLVDLRLPWLRGERSQISDLRSQISDFKSEIPETPQRVEVGNPSYDADRGNPKSAIRNLQSEIPARLPRPAAPPRQPFPWPMLLGFAWAGGSAICLGIIALRIVRFHGQIRFARPAGAALVARARQLAQQLGLRRCPPIFLIDSAVSPMLWPVGRARLLLPAQLWQGLSEKQQTALLVHELAHLRRCDHWVRFLELLATVLYWWHPLVGWGRRRCARLKNSAATHGSSGHCRAVRDYATALAETVDFLSDGRHLPVAASGVGYLGDLMHRVRMIMSKQAPRRMTMVGRLAVLAVALGGLPLMPKLVSAEGERERPAQPADNTDRRDDTAREERKRPRGDEPAEKPAEERRPDRRAAEANEPVRGERGARESRRAATSPRRRRQRAASVRPGNRARAMRPSRMAAIAAPALSPGFSPAWTAWTWC